MFGGIDLREHGSGNLGASNTFRFLGAGVAIPVLVLDAAKGFAPVFIAPRFATEGVWSETWLMLVALFFSVLGHMFSPFVGFKGGKGVATTAGGLMALTPIAFLWTFVVWAVVMAATRIVSLASMVAAIALPIVVVGLRAAGRAAYPDAFVAVSIAVTLVVLVKHRSNVRRLLAGEEPALRRQKR